MCRVFRDHLPDFATGPRFRPHIKAMLAAAAAASPSVATASVADGRAAVPFPMSRVTLMGDWKHAQDANQEVPAVPFALIPPLPPRS